MTHKHRADSWLVPRAPQALLLPPATHFSMRMSLTTLQNVSPQFNKTQPCQQNWVGRLKIKCDSDADAYVPGVGQRG